MAEQFQCIVVTPERTVRDEQADFVALPLYDGEIGLAAEHSPMIGRLGYGEMRIRTGDTTVHYYVEGGFVEVINNVVSILTNRAIPTEQLDEALAREQLATAMSRPAHSPETMAQRDQLVDQARAQLAVLRKAK